MSTQGKEGLKDCLFSRQDKKLLNIKFARGDGANISADQLQEQVHAIARQHAAGIEPASGPVRSAKKPINVRKLVAGM